MVVVLRDEKGEVEKTHWGLEAGMKRRADPIGLVGRLELGYHRFACCTELRKNLPQRAVVVVSLESFPVLQVGRLEFYSTHSQIMHSSHPERLEIP